MAKLKLELSIDESIDEKKLVYQTTSIDDPFIKSLKRILDTEDETLGRAFIKQNGQLIPVDFDDITCLYTEERHLIAETRTHKGVIDYKIGEIERFLDEKKFFRVNQSEIVHLDSIEKLDLSIDGTVKIVLKSGQVTFVARRRYKDFKNWIGLK